MALLIYIYMVEMYTFILIKVFFRSSVTDIRELTKNNQGKECESLVPVVFNN